jgi:hypothetical protein
VTPDEFVLIPKGADICDGISTCLLTEPDWSQDDSAETRFAFLQRTVRATGQFRLVFSSSSRGVANFFFARWFRSRVQSRFNSSANLAAWARVTRFSVLLMSWNPKPASKLPEPTTVEGTLRFKMGTIILGLMSRHSSGNSCGQARVVGRAMETFPGLFSSSTSLKIPKAVSWMSLGTLSQEEWM